MSKTLNAIRTDYHRRLKRRVASLAVLGLAFIVMGALTFTDSLPAAQGDDRISSFLGGFIMGLILVATFLTATKAVELKRALKSDAALKALYAKEHDELKEHVGREVGAAFVQVLPVLTAVAVAAAALVSYEAVLAAAGTAILFALALYVITARCKARYLTDEAADA